MGVSYVDIWMKSFPGRKKMISVKPLSRSVPGVYLWKQLEQGEKWGEQQMMSDR